jgi:hypothetical protein
LVIVSDAFGFADAKPVGGIPPSGREAARLMDLMRSFWADINFPSQPNFPKPKL